MVANVLKLCLDRICYHHGLDRWITQVYCWNIFLRLVNLKSLPRETFVLILCCLGMMLVWIEFLTHGSIDPKNIIPTYQEMSTNISLRSNHRFASLKKCFHCKNMVCTGPSFSLDPFFFLFVSDKTLLSRLKNLSSNKVKALVHITWFKIDKNEKKKYFF